MSRRLVLVAGILGALCGIAVLILLAMRPEPDRPQVVITAPPVSHPAAVDPELRAVKRSGTLMGRVINGQTKEGIGNVKVVALTPHLKPPEKDEEARWGDLIERATVVTDQEGQFRVSDLPADYWNLWVEKRGYAWTTVPRAHFDLKHEIELFPACSVHGKVVYPDGKPASGVRLEYHVQGTHSEVFSHYRLESYYTTTKKDGTFEYTDLPQGKFTLEVYPENHLPAPWKYEQPLAPGENRDLGVHKLDDGFSMTVHVKWRGTEEGVPDIEVVVRPIGDPMPRTKPGQRRRTDSDGIARFQGLGGQVLGARPKFLITANVPGVGPVMPDVGGMNDPNQTITVYLRKDATLTGKVIRPNGEPLEHFFIQLEPVGHITRQLQGFHENGEFTMYQVPEGEYLVHARYGNLIDQAVKVTAVGGQVTDVGTIRLSHGAEIHGVVRRANGKELEGVVRVNLGRKVKSKAQQDVWDIVGRSYCLANGSFSIKGIPEGKFFLWPEAYKTPSATTDPLPITVGPDLPVLQQDVVLYGDAFLNLRFFDLVKGQVTHVHAPPTYLIETATGAEIQWRSVGERVRPGTYRLEVDLKDNEGVLKRYKVKTVVAREAEAAHLGGEQLDPIEIRLFEIRDDN